MANVVKIPDLSHLKPLSYLLAAKQIFKGNPVNDRTGYALLSNFTRLVDFSLIEYELGRLEIIEYFNIHDRIAIGRALRASSHFEVCIGSLKRSIDHLKAIRRYKLMPQTIKDIFPRKLIVLSGPIESQISSMRHAIMHLEEKITKGEILDGEYITLAFDENYLLLGPNRISYNDLASWLEDLYSACTKLVQIR